MRDFEDFIAVRGDSLMRFALMLAGDPHRAEDLVQTALARIYPRSSPAGRPPSAPWPRALASLRAALPHLDKESLP